MSYLSLCCIRIEVTGDNPLLPTLHYLAPKDKMASVNAGNGKCTSTPDTNGAQPVVTIRSTPSKFKDLRAETTIKVDTYTCNPSSPKSPAKSVKNKKADHVNYLSGNPCVEITKGIVHLYKENERTSTEKTAKRSDMLVMLCIPAVVSCRDLLQFIAPSQQDMNHVKVIRTNEPNVYMILIKFKSQKSADFFYKSYNGRKFNSIEDDICQLAYVSRVETLRESKDSRAMHVPDHTELPTCPVCLERMDESIEGVLTVLCNHSFHASCMIKWGDTSCPVCRYVQSPEMVASNQCSECEAKESLWICLICGHIGCGRYVAGHAFKHYCETGHSYAIQPDNNRVWDYVGDNFVHRLFQNKDGKPVEFRCYDDDDNGMEAKMNDLQLEFSYTLTKQLNSQREYYEKQLQKQEEKYEGRVKELEDKFNTVVGEKLYVTKEMEQEKKDFTEIELRVVQLKERLNKAYVDLQEEKQMNSCLRADASKWRHTVRSLENAAAQFEKVKMEEIQDLKDQVRDLMFYLNAQDTINGASEPMRNEIAGGTVVIGSPKPSTSKGARRQKKH